MMMTFKNLDLPVAIIGLGLSGKAALRLLLLAGVSREQIALFDDKGSADFSSPEKLLNDFEPKTLIVSPGYPLSTPWIQEALQKGVQLTSELSLAFEQIKSEKTIGITGSVGKSTTTSLIGHGLSKCGDPFFIGGNLGYPLADYICDVFEKTRPRANWICLELSSYQLENCKGLRLCCGVITFFTGNHLERYPSIEAYYSAKEQMLNHLEGPLLLNSMSPDLCKWFQHRPTANMHFVSPASLNTTKKPALIGTHNLQNIALALAVGDFLQLPSAFKDAVYEYKGLPHRLENIGTFNQIRFINDSKATAVDSVLSAVESCEVSDAETLWLLVGGKDKNLPWEKLSDLKKSKNIQFLFFGACRDVAQSKSGLNGPQFVNLKEAISFVVQNAKPLDTVLLSPGGTSLDEFKNFEERGHFFCNQVTEFYKSLT